MELFDIKNVFPIVFHRYSYIFEYLFIYACSNIINNFVYSLSKQKLKLIVVILLINYSIVPSIFSWFFKKKFYFYIFDFSIMAFNIF